jgi:uncharacterized phage-like protein YoqJ
MVIWGSGHRPDKLGGYTLHIQTRLIQLAEAGLRHYDAEGVISGMAIGWDQALANAALNLGIKLYAFIPFIGQESRWNAPSQKIYNEILDLAHYVEVCSEGGYHPEKMQIRNQKMVEAGDFGLVLWDGTSGGTGNCLTYAREVKKPYKNLWDSWVKYK